MGQQGQQGSQDNFPWPAKADTGRIYLMQGLILLWLEQMHNFPLGTASVLKGVVKQEWTCKLKHNKKRES